jgi:acyl dehydratase
MTTSSGVHLPSGTYEEARAMIGLKVGPLHGDVAVNRATIFQFAGAVEDANPSYWDDEFAARTWGGLISPPAMLMVWTVRLRWHPDGARSAPAVLNSVPLPGERIVNIENDVEFFAPILEGDRLSVEEEFIDISPEKTTAIGTGHFMTTRSTFRRESGDVVARQTNTLFRFSAHASGSTAVEGG